jgi:hypothetical protein
MTEEKKNDAAQILHEDNNKLPTGEMLLPSLLEEDEKSGAISVEEWLAITSGGTCKALELSPDAERWHEIRKEEALAIDPETAEVCWDYGEYSDPYKLYPVVPEFPVDPLERCILFVVLTVTFGFGIMIYPTPFSPLYGSVSRPSKTTFHALCR